jgi:hypothetical protein
MSETIIQSDLNEFRLIMYAACRAMPFWLSSPSLPRNEERNQKIEQLSNSDLARLGDDSLPTATVIRRLCIAFDRVEEALRRFGGWTKGMPFARWLVLDNPTWTVLKHCIQEIDLDEAVGKCSHDVADARAKAAEDDALWRRCRVPPREASIGITDYARACRKVMVEIERECAEIDLTIEAVEREIARRDGGFAGKCAADYAEAVSDISVDGPVGNYGWLEAGTVFQLQKGSWRLVKFLHERPIRGGRRSATFEQLAEPVYGEHGTKHTVAAFRGLAKGFNTAFGQHTPKFEIVINADKADKWRGAAVLQPRQAEPPASAVAGTFSRA